MLTMWVRNSLDYVAGQAEVAKVVCEIGADADDVGSLEILELCCLQAENGLPELFVSGTDADDVVRNGLGKQKTGCRSWFVSHRITGLCV